MVQHYVIYNGDHHDSIKFEGTTTSSSSSDDNEELDVEQGILEYFPIAQEVVKEADVQILVVGLSPSLVDEEKDPGCNNEPVEDVYVNDEYGEVEHEQGDECKNDVDYDHSSLEHK